MMLGYEFDEFFLGLLFFGLVLTLFGVVAVLV